MAQPEPNEAFLKQVFRRVDTDGSGSISSNELQSALSNGTWSPFNPETVRMMIGMFDRDGSSTIDFQEFRDLWKYVTDWERCFRKYDLDGSGTIDKHELKTALSSFVIRKFDRTGRGTVAFDDFIQACVSIQTLTNAFRHYDRYQSGEITIGYEDFLTLVFSLKM
ncbi:unnamed protein product [Rotaria sp. Silwood2]|nr:unnamed protein product [Rotaria sp. Silwood2]